MAPTIPEDQSIELVYHRSVWNLGQFLKNVHFWNLFKLPSEFFTFFIQWYISESIPNIFLHKGLQLSNTHRGNSISLNNKQIKKTRCSKTYKNWFFKNWNFWKPLNIQIFFWKTVRNLRHVVKWLYRFFLSFFKTIWVYLYYIVNKYLIKH